MNRWRIPASMEKEIRVRDIECIYCGISFGSAAGRGSDASWEHIVNDGRIITSENIALCCRSCNSSKGAKLLSDWLRSDYCSRRKITSQSVGGIVKRALANQPVIAPSSGRA